LAKEARGIIDDYKSVEEAKKRDLHDPSIAPTTSTMLSRQLLRSSGRLHQPALLNASRQFSGSTRRKAEVELTIGTFLCCIWCGKRDD
jgi:hypothetical protein